MAPEIFKYLLANSLTGAGTPPANALRFNDIVVLTTKSTLTSGGNTVARQLLAADKTAHYKEGTPVAGLLGIALDDVQTNASGVAQGPPALGGITTNAAIPYPLSGPAMQQTDVATGRSYINVATFGGSNIFSGGLNTSGGAITLQHQYDDTLAGITISTTSGITTFSIDPLAAAADQCVRIIGPDESDPLYNTLVGTTATVFPRVFFQVLGSFAQILTGVPYATQ